MRLYADRPTRLLRQVLGDLGVLVAGYLAVQLGRGTHERLAALAAPGRQAEDAARTLDGQLRSAAADIAGAPLVGAGLARPFRDLAATSRELAGAAQGFQDTVERVAVLAGLLVAVLPVLVLLSVWLPRRLAWVVEASAAARLRSGGPGTGDLLAVRALARQSLPRLHRLAPDLAARWRAGDPEVIRDLAALELADLGLRPWPRR